MLLFKLKKDLLGCKAQSPLQREIFFLNPCLISILHDPLVH